jgi:hypothetical protein
MTLANKFKDSFSTGIGLMFILIICASWGNNIYELIHRGDMIAVRAIGVVFFPLGSFLGFGSFAGFI